MKIYVFNIKTYCFGNVKYRVHIIADNEQEALGYLYDYPKYKNDEDAEIESIGMFDENDKGII